MMDNPKYIDLNKLTARLPVLTSNDGKHYVSTADVAEALSLAAAETGDVVEVVRCDDCRFFSSFPCKNRDGYDGHCHGMNHGTLVDDYCSYGKRKEKNHDSP